MKSLFLILILFLINILFFLAVIFERPSAPAQTHGEILLIISSRYATGAQIFGSAVVDHADSGSASIQELFQQTIQFGNLDESGTNLILSNVIQAQDNEYFTKKQPLCIGTQSSFDQLHKLPEFVASWPGPISLAVFAPGAEFFLSIAYAKYLRTCFPAIKSQVNWHFAFPANFQPTESTLYLIQNAVNCSLKQQDALAKIQSTLDSNYQEELATKRKNHEFPYPQNVMRNIARQHCISEWVMCPDIDMVFPRVSSQVQPPLTKRLTDFLQTTSAKDCGKCAFVFPLYELQQQNFTLPENKSELLTYKKKGWAQQYHIKVFSPNQAASKLLLWENRKEENVKIAYKINYSMYYEPVYVAKQGTPKFDERYVGYGMTRNTQAYEMALAGYTFYLLDGIFLSHIWGFQKKEDFQASRKEESTINNRFFTNVHVRELAARYDSDKFDVLRQQKTSRKFFNILMKKVH